MKGNANPKKKSNNANTILCLKLVGLGDIVKSGKARL